MTVGSTEFFCSIKMASWKLARSVARCVRLAAPALGKLTCESSSLLSRSITYRSPLYQVQLSAGLSTSTQRLNEHVINIQDTDDFTKRVTKNTTPVVVDFHASWCGPCKLLGPRLEALIAGKKGKVILAKIDIDELSDLAVNHGVEAVPTVIAMKNGKVVDKFVGLKDDAALESFVNKLIGS